MEPQKQNGKRKPGGRPRKHAIRTGKLTLLGVLVPAQLKARISAQSKTTGRSLSKEAELRLERSFWLDDMLKAKLLCELPEMTAGLSKRPARDR
jgi:hypothetical protein